jgi:hypothetical protein
MTKKKLATNARIVLIFLLSEPSFLRKQETSHFTLSMGFVSGLLFSIPLSVRDRLHFGALRLWVSCGLGFPINISALCAFFSFV